MTPLLTANSLSLRAGSRTLCYDLSFNIKTGERWGLLGKNGAGKTSLLHTLAGLRTPAAGDVLLGDQNLSTLPRMQLGRYLGPTGMPTTVECTTGTPLPAGADSSSSSRRLHP